MFGLFSKKNPDGTPKLPGPRDVPDPVGQQLVVTFKEDPEWAWKLKSVQMPMNGEPKVFNIRVFSQQMAAASKITVKDYTTLDAHPNLVLYEGMLDMKTHKAKLERRYKKD
jgi:hypothetical protein